MSKGISGNQGVVLVGGSTIGELTKWTYDEDPGVQKYFAQAGVVGGIAYPRTVQGNTDVTGDLEGKIDGSTSAGTASALQIGAIVTLILYHVKPTVYRSFNARITKYHTEADIESGAVQPFTASYQLDGPITKVGV